MTKVITDGQMLVRLIIIIVGFVISISATYLWLVPKFFPGYSSYSILIVGGTMAGMFGGYLSIKSCPNSHKVLSVFWGLFVAALVTVLSLLIIVYVMGV